MKEQMSELGKALFEAASNHTAVWQAGFRAGKEVGRREAFSDVNRDLERLKKLIGKDKT